MGRGWEKEGRGRGRGKVGVGHIWVKSMIGQQSYNNQGECMFAEEFDPYQENSLDLLLKFSHETDHPPQLADFTPHPTPTPTIICPDDALILLRFEEPPTSILQDQTLELEKMRKAADSHERLMAEIQRGRRNIKKVRKAKEQRTEQSENSPLAGRKRKQLRKARL